MTQRLKEQEERDIKFIMRQNKALKQQLQDALQVIRVNKQSIDILSNARTQKSSRVNMTMDSGHTNAIKSRQETRLLEVVKMLNNQNSDLMKEVEVLKQQNEQLNTKILLLEQITQASEKHEQRTVLQLESQMKSLNKTLISAQDKLRETEQIRGHFDSISGLMIKYREVHGFTEQAARFRDEQGRLENQINVLKIKLEDSERVKERLISHNVRLQSEVNKLKVTMLMPNRSIDAAGEASLKRLALYFIEAQRRVLEDSDFEEDLELVAPELMVIFPDRVQQVQGVKEKPKVPRLNLMRAHEMMLHNQKKIEADLKRRNVMGKTERITKLQEQLEFTRRELTRTMLQLKEAEQTVAKNARQIEQLSSRNDLLTQSNQLMKRKMQQYKSHSKKKEDLNKTFNVSFMNCTFYDRNNYTKETSPRLNKIEEKKEKKKDTQNDDYLLTEKEQFEIQANNLAHDIAKLPFVSGLDKTKNKAGPKQTLMRSYSNPLLYVEQRKGQIFNRKSKQFALMPQPRHHDETCFDRINTQGRTFQQNLDQIQL